MDQHIIIWIISFLAIAGVIIRPFKLNEAIWAAGGAVLLVCFGCIDVAGALTGISKGIDVYLFLIGMMLLAETARQEKLFDWLAAYATQLARGSSARLFLLIYVTGVVVTIFLSNDATAVVLTPAVAAAVRAAKIKQALPYLLICAFIANAASFVLPISNPANLVIYGEQLPSLWRWLQLYTLPSVAAIIATYLVLYLTQRRHLQQRVETDIVVPELSAGAKTAVAGIFFTILALLMSSAFNVALGLPTFVTGLLTAAIVIVRAKINPIIILRGVSWLVLPLVAGLFVIVEALNYTGITQHIGKILQQTVHQSAQGTVWLSGLATAFGCNLMNNLPAGLMTGNIVKFAHAPQMIKSAVLIGVDLGPNLSVTGSLATILWLVALRRENIKVSGIEFLKLGSLVMTIALVLTLAMLWI